LLRFLLRELARKTRFDGFAARLRLLKLAAKANYEAAPVWWTVVGLVARRAMREPIDKGGWSIFYTYLGGMGNISPGPDIAIRASGLDSWFGWPTDPKMEALREAWFDAPDLAAQQHICRQMQILAEPVLCAARHVRPAGRVPFLPAGRARRLAAVLRGPARLIEPPQ